MFNFEEETRSGHLVSKEMKKLWHVELQSLEKLKSICQKYGLTYYVIGGGLIGAARHQGFIPWDDDIDVALMWDDYKKLIEVGPKECEYPFFFQTYINEPEAEPTFSRLRRSDTTGCTKWEYECLSCDYNKGIFIDIFPLFNLPESEDKLHEQQERIMSAWRAYKGYEVDREIRLTGSSKFNPEYEKYIEDYKAASKLMDFAGMKQKYVDCCAMEEDNTTERVGLLSFRCRDERLYWKRSWFGRGVEMPFEDTVVNCPEEWDKLLTHQYGDWRTPVKGLAFHDVGVIDTETPYREKFGI